MAGRTVCRGTGSRLPTALAILSVSARKSVLASWSTCHSRMPSGYSHRVVGYNIHITDHFMRFDALTSSSTMSGQCRGCSPPDSISSRMRPGVPTTSSGRCLRRASCCRLGFAPPMACCARCRCAAGSKPCATLRICIASSWLGETTSTCTACCCSLLAPEACC